MKSWQEWTATLVGWMREHPSATRWGAIAAIVVALIVFIGNQSFPGQKTVALFDSRQLTADEIGLMQVAFGKSGLNEYEIQNTQVKVPREHRADYLKALADHDAVPRDLRSQSETPSSFDFFQTRAQQRLQQIARKKRTIRDMVMQLRFVERAIVDYDETRGATPFEDMQRTAVVNVSPADNRVLSLSEVKAIRDTVRGAVAGLQARDITIIDTFASKSHTGVAGSEAEQLQPHTITKMQAERKYETKIRSALTAYPGIRVNVEVGIDPVVRRIRDERKVEGQPVVVEHTIQRETAARVPSTTPSLLNNVFDQGANGQARVNPFHEPFEKRSTEKTQSVANGTFQTTESAGPTVTHVNVSIGIPERCVQYFVDRNNTGRQPDEVELRKQGQNVFEQLQLDIRQKVGPLVPIMGDPQKGQQIVVTVDREIPLPMAAEPAETWTNGLATHWPWLVVIGGGLFLLAFFRPIGKNRHHGMQRMDAAHTHTNSPTEDQPEYGFAVASNVTTQREHAKAGHPGLVISDEQPMTSIAEAVHGNERKQELYGDSPLDVATQRQMRGQLDQWCRENPGAAAATIRQWLDRKAG